MLLMLDDWACDSWAQKRARLLCFWLASVFLSLWSRLPRLGYDRLACTAVLRTTSDIASIKNAANHARWSPRLAGWCGCRPAAHSTHARGGAAGAYECEPSAENDQRNRRPDGETILMLATLEPRPARQTSTAKGRRTQASSPGRSRSERTAWVVISDPNRGSWTATRSSV